MAGELKFLGSTFDIYFNTNFYIADQKFTPSGILLLQLQESALSGFHVFTALCPPTWMLFHPNEQGDSVAVASWQPKVVRPLVHASQEYFESRQIAW